MSINVTTVGTHSLNHEPVYLPDIRCVGYVFRCRKDSCFYLWVREYGPLREGESEYNGISLSCSSLWVRIPLGRCAQLGFTAELNGVFIRRAEDMSAV